MWSILQPSEKEIREFVSAQKAVVLSYREVGASAAEQMPAGYTHDHNRVQLGRGDEVFAAACAALREWKMFPAPWTKIFPQNAPIETGANLAMVAHVYGQWWLNGCRIIYTIDEAGPVRRFGFAYGTLTSHVERGEERFLVECLEDGSVWYELRAFSQPRHWLVKLMKPLARVQQRRFAAESKAAMLSVVKERVSRQ